VTIRGDSLAVNGDISGATPYEEDAAILIDIDDPTGSANIDISCNEISRNGVPGIQLANATYPDIHHNAIFGNERGKSGTRHNIILAENFGGFSPTVNARSNYWGAPYTDPADSVIIKGTILDGDSGAPGVTALVIVGPWLNDWPDSNCQ
jgi:parallel beta-helix repeat protein